jgi:hypothetical protein
MTAGRLDDFELADALHALRRAEANVSTPARVEGAVLARWDEAHAARRRTPRSLWRNAAAIAAGILIIAGLSQLGRELKMHVSGAARLSHALANQGTLLLVGEPIYEGEPVRVVRMRVPAATLTGLGVRPTVAGAAHVDVDVFVGEDGIARAIRVGM